MFKLLESSYNKKNKCGFLLFNYKSIKMTDLLSKIGVNDFFAIIEETDGSVDYSSSLHYIVQNDNSVYSFVKTYTFTNVNETKISYPDGIL